MFTDQGGVDYIPDDEDSIHFRYCFYVASDGVMSDTSFVVLSKLAVGVDLADIMKSIQFILILISLISDLMLQ